jgi:hypothetical protein
MAILPQHVLLEIFENGCELELGEYPITGNPAFPELHKRTQLKPFARNVSKVCTLWKNIILEKESFRITRIILRQFWLEKNEMKFLSQAQQLLSKASNSDIDFELVWPRNADNLEFYPMGQEFIQNWLKSCIYPNIHRLRIIRAMRFPPAVMGKLLEHLG